MNRSKFSFLITASLVAVLLTCASVAQAGKGGTKGPNPGADNPGTTDYFDDSFVVAARDFDGGFCFRQQPSWWSRTCKGGFDDEFAIADPDSFAMAIAYSELSCSASAGGIGLLGIEIAAEGALLLRRHGINGSMHHIKFDAGVKQAMGSFFTIGAGAEGTASGLAFGLTSVDDMAAACRARRLRECDGEVVIDFESLSCDEPVDYQFIDQNVDFSGSATLGIQVPCGYNDYYYPPWSGQGIVYNPTQGQMRVDSVTHPWTSIGGFVTGASDVTLTAYAADDSVLGTDSTGGANITDAGTGLYPNIFLSVDAPGIAYAIFSDGGNQVTIDDLTFDSCSTRLLEVCQRWDAEVFGVAGALAYAQGSGTGWATAKTEALSDMTIETEVYAANIERFESTVSASAYNFQYAAAGAQADMLIAAFAGEYLNAYVEMCSRARLVGAGRVAICQEGSAAAVAIAYAYAEAWAEAMAESMAEMQATLYLPALYVNENGTEDTIMFSDEDTRAEATGTMQLSCKAAAESDPPF